MLDDKPIHENVRFIAAGNPQSMVGALSNKVPTPLLNKFLHLNLKIVASEWIEDYALPAKLHPAIISFIDSKPDWLINNTIRDDNIKAHIANKSFPTPRTIDYASKALYAAERLGLEESFIYTFIAAAVGPDFTTEFMNFYKDVYKVPSARDIISGKAKKSDVDVAQQFYLVNSLLQYLSDAYTKANNNSGDETYSKEMGILFQFIKESCSNSMLMAFLTRLFKIYKLGIDFRKNKDIADTMMKDKDFRYLMEYAQR